MGRSSLDATKARLMRIALCEGWRLRRALVLDRVEGRVPLFRVDLLDAAVFLEPGLAVADELDFAGLAGEDVASEDCAAATETHIHAAREAATMRMPASAENGEQKYFIRSL
jgi:hypothetical protein